MRRTVLCFFFIMCLAGLSFAVSPNYWSTNSGLPGWTPFTPSAVDSGGPDAYGYWWKVDGEPGVPAYNWKDITVIGTPVTLLGDDNYVGPYPTGFPFHYYWYDVTQFWVGSNGYLEFGPPYNAASPFPTVVPSTAQPNNYLAILMADLDLSTQGTCYRWNNADSCVISWINVPAWGPSGNVGSHTFQIILSRLDSNITFQYGAQTGTVYNNASTIAIENVSGQVGLMRALNILPLSNTVTKWYHPATTNYQAHDMGVTDSYNPGSLGSFVLSGASVNPWGQVKNVGNQVEATFTVNLTIKSFPGAVVVYNQTQTLGPLNPGVVLPVPFTPAWTASAVGEYTVTTTVTLTGDQNPTNNAMTTELHVLTLPGAMSYDEGLAGQGWSWQGGYGGLGQHFVPASYPSLLDSVEFYCYSAGTSPFIAKVFDDDGPNGMPGTQLWQQTISTPTTLTWYRANPNLTITSGGFYVAWIEQDSLTAPIGIDNNTTNPVSRQGWEFTGVWSNYRNSETMDIMIRAHMQSAAAPSPHITMTPISGPIHVPANGGSFSFNAAVMNTGTQVPFVVWCRMQYPNLTYTATTVGPVTINPPPNVNVNRNRNQNIPASYPTGHYKYWGYANLTYTYPVLDSNYFAFDKLAVANGGPEVWDATCSGELFPGEIPVSVPATFTVANARPNPFNPTTTISFTLPEATNVTLNVYDVSGRQVVQLVNDMRAAGQHSVTFDGTNLSSGIYLYTLTAGAQTATGKMVLMK